MTLLRRYRLKQTKPLFKDEDENLNVHRHNDVSGGGNRTDRQDLTQWGHGWGSGFGLSGDFPFDTIVSFGCYDGGGGDGQGGSLAVHWKTVPHDPPGASWIDFSTLPTNDP